jgi:Undecaprenyl-phosphate glucose phosphotransferase
MQNSSAQARSGYIDSEVVARLLKGLDFTVLTLITLTVTTLTVLPTEAANQSALVGAFTLFLSFLVLLALRSFGLYETRQLAGGQLSIIRSAAATVACGAFSFAVFRMLVLPVGWSWLPVWSGLALAHMVGVRLAARAWAEPAATAGRFRRRIAIVGGGQVAEDALRTLETSRDIDIETVGIFDDRLDRRSPDAIGKAYKIGKIADLADYARSNRVDLIIVAIPLSAEARLLTILKKLWVLPVDIRISGKASGLKFSPHAYTYLGNLPLLSVFDRPLIGWELFVKNVVERLLAVIGIVALSPVMLAVAAAIKLESRGPVIFRQKRYGFNNELIEVYKFRSMYTDRSDANAVKLVTKDDPRVTRVGRFIRKASIDELPQLFNVLTGQLSLVGPRPHATQAKAADALYESVVDGYFARHKVRPGITGWAQINGWRGETDTREKIEQRVKHDLEYIDRWSLWFDLKIIIKTPFALLKSENAY